MRQIENKTFDQERALYGSRGLAVSHCSFDGPADGESAFKECRDIQVSNSFFNLRYPFWHDDGLTISGCELTEKCRAALWYSENVQIADTKFHGIKALRECGNVKMKDCDVVSAEFGWSVRGMEMTDCSVQGEYFMMRSDHLHFTNVQLKGKYSFQYIEDSVFENCVLDTKDAFWHAKNVVIRNCVVKGEYLAWYCENVTFENCRIMGTQPLCYCKGLKLVNCEMVDTDLCFEKSEVEATLTAPVISIKNPRQGFIYVPAAEELIYDDEDAKGIVMTEAGSNLENARSALKSQGYTCVLWKDGIVHTTTLRGVRPLVQWLEEGLAVRGFSAADKVVGKATAFLYCLLGVTELYAGVVSKSALAVLKENGIRTEYGELVENIINRKGDGICPFEEAVLGVEDPQEALGVIHRKLEEMKPAHYRHVQNRNCEYFPCHKTKDDKDFNCLFCYCPLYALGEQCGGNFSFLDNGIKDCSGCMIPHSPGGYDYVLSKFKDVAELAKRREHF